jgi:hypothetical protein
LGETRFEKVVPALHGYEVCCVSVSQLNIETTCSILLAFPRHLGAERRRELTLRYGTVVSKAGRTSVQYELHFFLDETDGTTPAHRKGIEANSRLGSSGER